jgi:hypothetical protein
MSNGQERPLADLISELHKKGMPKMTEQKSTDKHEVKLPTMKDIEGSILKGPFIKWMTSSQVLKTLPLEVVPRDDMDVREQITLILWDAFRSGTIEGIKGLMIGANSLLEKLESDGK